MTAVGFVIVYTACGWAVVSAISCFLRGERAWGAFNLAAAVLVATMPWW